MEEYIGMCGMDVFVLVYKYILFAVPYFWGFDTRVDGERCGTGRRILNRTVIFISAFGQIQMKAIFVWWGDFVGDR